MSSRSKKQRPPSTAAISLPQVHDASTQTALTQFSPNADLLAFLSLAVDKHRLRIFDATTGSALVEHTVDAARVTSLSWLLLDLTSGVPRKDASPSKKRKKTVAPVTDAPQTKTQLVCLGLSNGSVVLFSPTHARVLRTISHPSSLTAVLAASAGTQHSHLWSSSADGTVRLWDAARNSLLGSWRSANTTIPYSALAVRPDQDLELETELLVANHSMRLLTLPASTSSISEPEKAGDGISFTGHASNVTHLQWDHSQPSRFISAAEADRVLNVWQVPDAPSKQGGITANIPLDAFARHTALSSADPPTLLTVSASGKVALFELPSPSKGTKIVTLSPRSIISSPSQKGDDRTPVIAATFVRHELGRLRVARLVGGVKPVFEEVRYLGDAGEFISEVSLSKDASSGLAATAEGGSSTSQRRYVEAPELAVQSGFELAQEADLDAAASKGIDGDLDVDLAELSLGQRLTALAGGTDLNMGEADASSTSENEGISPLKQTTARRKQKSRTGKGSDEDYLPVPAHSLSRTLVQALHSADTGLLETCLLHSDEKLVMNTVRRLPPQLAVPLVTACVERLGRGARANSGKGGGGGASAQRGTGLLRWIRAVLVVHTAHLMTIPDLVTRLSTLHATLTARLALRDPLLALSGRLELVLSQIELRASAGPTPLAPESKASKQKEGKQEPFKYVEGESESEEDDEDEMEVERDDDAGSLEDVELGRDSASEEEAEESESEEGSEENEEGSEEEMGLIGFIDDEAEEWSEEDEDVEE
ncbi:NUC189-domain-containing protein [Ramaria rubella]|nr:NUC189-domain-containing protein [Ramaria rubella]